MANFSTPSIQRAATNYKTVSHPRPLVAGPYLGGPSLSWGLHVATVRRVLRNAHTLTNHNESIDVDPLGFVQFAVRLLGLRNDEKLFAPGDILGPARHNATELRDNVFHFFAQRKLVQGDLLVGGPSPASPSAGGGSLLRILLHYAAAGSGPLSLRVWWGCFTLVSPRRPIHAEVDGEAEPQKTHRSVRALRQRPGGYLEPGTKPLSTVAHSVRVQPFPGMFVTIRHDGERRPQRVRSPVCE